MMDLFSKRMNKASHRWIIISPCQKILLGDIFYLLDYVTRRSENIGISFSKIWFGQLARNVYTFPSLKNLKNVSNFLQIYLNIGN